MKIKIDKGRLGGQPPAQFLRRAGYAYLLDPRDGQESFARRFSRDFYPRFHLYVQEETGKNFLYFNLHLDHKKASYAGQTRHSADYDGELVEGEAARLEALLGAAVVSSGNVNRSLDSKSPMSLAAGLPPSVPTLKRRGFWSRLFS